jgi:hypothetical protein
MIKPMRPPSSVMPHVVVIVILFLLMAGAVGLMYRHAAPGPVEATRWAERATNLAQLNRRAREQLESFGWVSQERGVVRLPITRAMELVVSEWQDPAAGRSNLIARMQKALPPMPQAPAATNPPAGPKAK